MKVSGPGSTQGPSKAGKTSKKTPASGESFGDMLAGGASESTAFSTTRSIAKVDALLAVQGAEDPTERAARQKAQKRADDILGELEKIRMAMLSGSLTLGHMVDIADVVASRRESVHDPLLTAIMDEIDLRAQVELAKMRLALGGAARHNEKGPGALL